MKRRSGKRIIADTFRDSRSNRVFHNVPGDAQHGFVAAKHVLVSVPLPETPTKRPLVVEPGKLFRPLDKRAAIRILLFPVDKQVEVIGHVTVRDECKSFVRRGAQNLRTHRFDANGVGDCFVALIGAIR